MFVNTVKSVPGFISHFYLLLMFCVFFFLPVAVGVGPRLSDTQLTRPKT